MTDIEALDLGRLAVACSDWRWLPGMRRLDGHRYLGDGEWARASPTGPQTGLHAPGQVPDFTDPCTAGGLLALVREAWGFPVYCRLRDSGNWECCVPASLLGVTEIHALVSALRAAPRSTP